MKTQEHPAKFPATSTLCHRFGKLALGPCLFASMSAVSLLHAEGDSQSVRTAPVGLATLRVPARSARALSVPLANPAVYSGALSAWEGTTLGVENAGWTQDQWGPFETNPHVVRVVTGGSAGQTFPILSNTVDTIVLPEGAGGRLVAGQRFEVVPVDTLAGLFGSNAEGFQTDADPAKADNILIHEGDAWATYYNDGTQWLREGDTTTIQNAVPLLPDQGIFLVRKAGTPLVISVAGEVTPATSASDLPADTITFLANPFPINTRLADLQLQEEPLWKAGPDAASADRVHVYAGKKWTIYFFDGKRWRHEGGSARNPLVTKGSAIVVERIAGSDIVHTPEPPYSLN